VKLTPPRLFLLLALLVLPAAIAARWQGSAKAGGPRFHPRPDALEYVAAAQAIAQSGRIYLQVGPLQVRPRYAPGWPLLLAAALRAGVQGPDLWRFTGLFGAALAFLLAAVASSAVLALAPTAEDGKPPHASHIAALAAGLTAGWIWALAPIAVGVGRTALSDEPAALAAVATLVFSGVAFLRGGDRPASLPAVLGGLALGLAATLRPVCAALLLPPLAILLAAALRRAGLRPLLPRADAWALGAAVFPVAAMLLLYRSGLSPWEWSGYAFWLPERYGRLSDTFNLRYALAPDESFRLGGSEPMSHLGVALRVLLGFPGLRVHHQLGLFWPIMGWLAALPVIAAARRRGVTVTPWIAAALILWTLAHVALFSLYFYPASRFYLAPLALCTALLATICGLGLARPGLTSRLPAAVAALLVLGLTAQGWAELQRARQPRRRDERTWSRFERWRSRSDAERAGRILPFDPLHAQALGLLTPEVVTSVHEWGTLPPTVHVRRLQDLGLLPR
jgi:hypothetical protein